MKRIEHRLRRFDRSAIKTDTICDRACREQRGCSQPGAEYNRPMLMVHEVQKQGLNLSENERAVLGADLLGTFAPLLHNRDDGIAEALRRNGEFDANPSTGLSFDQLDQQVQRR
jgi:hypothetical protein